MGLGPGARRHVSGAWCKLPGVGYGTNGTEYKRGYGWAYPVLHVAVQVPPNL